MARNRSHALPLLLALLLSPVGLHAQLADDFSPPTWTVPNTTWLLQPEGGLSRSGSSSADYTKAALAQESIPGEGELRFTLPRLQSPTIVNTVAIGLYSQPSVHPVSYLIADLLFVCSGGSARVYVNGDAKNSGPSTYTVMLSFAWSGFAMRRTRATR